MHENRTHGVVSPAPPLVLNMANGTWLGGAFLRGACGQEEDLCRRSNLFSHILSADKAGYYPIPECGCIVMPDVVVFRAAESSGYSMLETYPKVAVITAAAPIRPDVSTREAR